MSKLKTLEQFLTEIKKIKKEFGELILGIKLIIIMIIH